jgi:hypothetical protein
MVARGVIGGDPAIILRTPSTRTREGRNPFTGKIESLPMKDRIGIPHISGVAQAIAALKDCEVEVSGMGTPKNPPIPIQFNGPYHFAVTCRMSSDFRSTSDLHEESGGAPEVPLYGRLCKDVPRRGLVSNPHTLDLIEVPNAGCARFWVEFELGKSLFPRFDRGDLEFLDPAIVTEAENVFDIRFAQGCNWG